MRLTLTLICVFHAFLLVKTKPSSVLVKREIEDARPKLEWWQDTIFYQIYPRSFKDSNGDGIGDLKGITEKLKHLKELGIGGTWLSPIFKSPMADFGYDISDYRSIQPEYGTMEDFEKMIEVAKELDIKIVLDFVPNHSSDEHEWFQKSIQRDPEYENYYWWHPGKISANGTRTPPNNWISVFGGSAWEWNEVRQEYYYHTFQIKQPDFNFREPKMVQAMKDVLTFWLDKGVYGFRVDAVPHLVEDEHLTDEPRTNDPNATPNDWGYLDHIYTKDRPENFEIIHGWSETLNQYSASSDGIPRVMMLEAYTDVKIQMKYMDAGASFSFNFVFVNGINKDSSASHIKKTIDGWRLNVPSNYTSNWVVGNHDNDRVATACGPEKVDGVNLMVLTLPGIGIIYNGEEIGMENGHLTWEEHQDITCKKEEFDRGKCRDFVRTPFQWDDSHMAGFTSGNKPWLPVDPSYKKINLKAQKAAKESHYKVYQQMAELRKIDTLRYGDTDVIADENNVLIIKRTLKGEDSIVLVFNVDSKEQQISLGSKGSAKVLIRSINGSNYKVGDSVQLNQVKLAANSAYILQSSDI